MLRTVKEFILMVMSLGGAIAISPFAIIRFMQQNWIMALVDILMIAGMVIIFAYVYLTRRTHYPSIILALTALSGLSVVTFLKGAEVIYWAYPTMIGLYFILSPHLAVLFGSVTAIVLVLILMGTLELPHFIAILLTLAVNNIFAYIFSRGMNRHSQQLTELTRLDPLTNAGNRRSLDEKLREVTQLLERSHHDAALIFIDIDHFKTINDTYGHAMGDDVLIKLVASLKNRIRKSDYVYRMGGEEFVVLAMCSTENAVRQLAEDLRRLVEHEEYIEGHKVTTSLGVAMYQLNDPVGHWLERADNALYEAKRTGRNKVCFAN